MELTDWLALYAAALSSLIALWEFRKSRVAYKLQLMRGFNSATEGTPPEFGLSVGVTNTSAQPIFIGPVGLLTKEHNVNLLDRIKFFIKYRRIGQKQGWVHCWLDPTKIKQEVQTKLEPGEYFVVFFPMDTINELVSDSATKIIRARVQSQFDINRYSKSMDLTHKTALNPFAFDDN